MRVGAVELAGGDDLLLESLDERRCEHRVADQAGEQLAASSDGQLAPVGENLARPEKAGERSRRP